MVYRMEQGRLVADRLEDARPGENGRYLGTFPVSSEGTSMNGTVSHDLLETVFANQAPRFVSREGMDILCIQAGMLEKKSLFQPIPVYLFLQKDCLQMYCADEARLTGAVDKIREDGNPDNGFGEIICELFRQIVAEDSAFLEELEQGINRLEDEVLEGKPKNYTKKIFLLRKRLTLLSRHYEQLLDIFDEIELNENGLFESRALRLLKIVDGKVGRLYSSVQHLRDYVTQVREAYQSEVDISLNKTMKLFTVLTAIFLPLTLIAGWYGMNFDMPEYHSAFGYPAIILVSILVVGGTVAAFKRNKWF